jgi:type I restriction enzyme M protein
MQDRPYMTKKTTKADINFEQELWKAANELRGAVAENNIKITFYLLFS